MNTGKHGAVTAWEYAHKLQDQFGTSDSSLTADVCNVLAVNLLGALPTNQRSILGHYPIIVLPTRQVNACCIAGEFDGAVIALDYGLMSFLNVLNKAVLCRFNRFGMETTLQLDDAASKVQAAMDHFFGASADAPRWPVSPKRMLIAFALSNVQVAFVVGHELAHVLLGHLGEQSQVQIVKSKALSEPVLSFQNFHDLEFAADREAAVMVTDHFKKIYDPFFGANEPSYSQAGVDIFFTYLELIEFIFFDGATSETHPPGSLRRMKLREAVWNRLPEPSRELADVFATIVQLFRPLLKHTGAKS